MSRAGLFAGSPGLCSDGGASITGCSRGNTVRRHALGSAAIGLFHCACRRNGASYRRERFCKNFARNSTYGMLGQSSMLTAIQPILAAG